jgi:hypothetical protein
MKFLVRKSKHARSDGKSEVKEASALVMQSICWPNSVWSSVRYQPSRVLKHVLNFPFHAYLSLLE